MNRLARFLCRWAAGCCEDLDPLAPLWLVLWAFIAAGVGAVLRGYL